MKARRKKPFLEKYIEKFALILKESISINLSNRPNVSCLLLG